MWVLVVTCVLLAAVYGFLLQQYEVNHIPLTHLDEKMVHFPGDSLSPCPLRVSFDNGIYTFLLQKENVRGIGNIRTRSYTLKRNYLGEYFVYAKHDGSLR